MAWSWSGGIYQPGAAHNDPVAAGIWNRGVAFISDDTNSPRDFDVHGGVDANDITAGRQNLDYLNILSQNDLDPATRFLTFSKVASIFV